MNLKQRAKNLKSDIPAVYLALKDTRTPAAARITAAVTIAYALSPVDLIPDFIPVLGYLDDLIVLPSLVALTIRLIPHDVWEENKMAASGMMKNGMEKKWYFALPFVLVWLIIIFFIIKAIWL